MYSFPLRPTFCPRPFLDITPPNGSTHLQSINLHLTSIIGEKLSLMGDSFDSSMDNIPRTDDEALIPPKSTIQQSLAKQPPHQTTGTLSHEHLSSQHQLTQRLHVTRNTIRKRRQTLKYMTLDQKAVQSLTFHLRNQFTLLHYLSLSGTSPLRKSIIHLLPTISANQRATFPLKGSSDLKKLSFYPWGWTYQILEKHYRQFLERRSST